MSVHNLREIYKQLVSKVNIYEKEEAEQIVFLLLESKWEITKTDLLMGTTTHHVDELESEIKRINAGEPIQYILGECWFRGRKFRVNNSVLIPRSETEELVDHIVNLKPQSVLDLGTGSGCIPVSLALELEDSEIYAIDVSGDALEIAYFNAKNLQAKVRFAQADILNFTNPFDVDRFDLIVSNPPYVKKGEMKEMHQNVLDYEPHLALFVNDHDPLLFYRHIGAIGKKHLKKEGSIWVEINSYLGEETKTLFEEMGYSHQRLVRDIHDRDRFLEIKP